MERGRREWRGREGVERGRRKKGTNGKKERGEESDKRRDRVGRKWVQKEGGGEDGRERGGK